ncbi:Qat anti-phage system TatD family nuclease QatD [Mycobacterium sp. TY815]|uniref:Qat anti-phage system TatD family nuclease QatD n=1 Tax=Mycobacterium sp. TY815 TaxID=3050581 RepID=UPI002740D105|nr:Qat anti-phage system TatD family nuclease QatD [Mycobacterium sp. TY815]MDP7701094.1 TatD family hydrolase [Mycobacterium sp. TY815]
MTQSAPTLGVDFHCHLDLYQDRHAVIARAEAAQIYTLTVTTTPKAWPHNREMTIHTRYVHAALGLHPQLVADRAHELPLWEKHLSETRYVGEVGLDAGPRFYKSFDLQKQVFRRVLEACADAGDKILTVHSVRSAATVLDMIEKYMPRGRGTVVLHWFTGSLAHARRAADLECYFSVNAEMMRTSKGRALVAALPTQRLLTETDGPFTSSEYGRPAEPADTARAVESIAQARATSPDEISRVVITNLLEVLHKSRMSEPSSGLM